MAISYSDALKAREKLITSGTLPEEADRLIGVLHGKIKEPSATEKTGMELKAKPETDRLSCLRAMVNECNTKADFKFRMPIAIWSRAGKEHWDKEVRITIKNGKRDSVAFYAPTDTQLLATWAHIGIAAIVDYWKWYEASTAYAPLKEELRTMNISLPNTRASIDAPLA